MRRLIPFIIVSVGAHALGFVVMRGVLGEIEREETIFEVSALIRERPHVVEDSPPEPVEPSPAEAEPEERCDVSERAPRQAPRLRRRPPELPAPTPAEPEPPTLTPEELPPVSVDEPSSSPAQAEAAAEPSATPLPVSGSGGGSGSTSEPVGSSGEGRLSGREGGAGRRRGSSEGDGCREAAIALARRARATLSYPRWAEQMRLEGVVELTLEIGHDGNPRGLRVARSTGSEALDRYALQNVRRLRGLPTGCQRRIRIPVRIRPR